ncbi:enoyl-CoA hydratase/isomerase family protein [Streptomyces sp. I4(2020)]|uniref:enoyl-CoA hydratase/isomerase family protein n=1 Tax=Streptomyces sp. I4(2020) TaxID=2760981 RepID=UPI0018EE811D|nr:enoyl-CoA hydratase/isomerase family protein [Streptomyces sp. I4(2020)]MBJ6612660.1 enoyl-CoA hydratase/isomerase family protein [Streptomyces sp. I3(2020)]MBJ6629334.1 enoyl-CoA hydratase/isomerase family protein [Streptomyces sp. I4(2020)]
MSYDDLSALTTDVTDGVATVTIDHPPLNLMDASLLPSLRAFIARVRDDADVRVIVFESADPEFFIAHGDMAYLTDPDALPEATRAAIAAAPDATIPEGMNILQALSDEVRSLPQVTIGKLAGFARGAGNEFFMSLDMRFAAIGKSGQGQPEVLMGILPGGGGTVTMTRLAGRARALELILGAELVGAELAERYGLINRAVPAGELDAFVGSLARRIAGLRPDVIPITKAAVDAIAPPIPHAAYAVENEGLYAAFGDDVTELAHKLLAAGIQTREGEREHERIANSM